MRIVLTGGGTGGHLTPLVAVARKMKEKNPSTEFLFLGPDGKMEKEILEKEDIKISPISVGKLRRYFSLLNFLDFFRVIFGFFQSLWKLLIFMPDAVFAKGGYASFPVVIASWIYRIPVLIHESDSRPGLSNSILSKFAKRVAVAYPEAEKEFPEKQVVLTGNPLREDIAKGSREKAGERFGLTKDKPVIFVWGGSQGAKNINERIIDILPELLRNYQVVHQTGHNNFEEAKSRAAYLGIKSGHEGYYPIAFIGEELKDIFAICDLVISRSGSTSIAEIAANGKPCILIPLETSANDHQRMNAYAVAREEACLVLEENNLGKNILLTRIEEIMKNENLKGKLSQNIRKFHYPDAAERIAQGIMELVQ